MGSVSDEQFITGSLGLILKKHSRLDVLINNAGVASMNHLLTTPLSTIKNVFDTNFTGAFLCIREFSKALKNSKIPRIVNISSIAAEIEIEGELIYSASKTALTKLNKLSAIELAPFKITVNAIALPPFKSKLTNNVDKNKLELINKRRIVADAIELEHILYSIDYFCSPLAKHISGEVLRIGGVK